MGNIVRKNIEVWIPSSAIVTTFKGTAYGGADTSRGGQYKHLSDEEKARRSRNSRPPKPPVRKFKKSDEIVIIDVGDSDDDDPA